MLDYQEGIPTLCTIVLMVSRWAFPGVGKANLSISRKCLFFAGSGQVLHELTLPNYRYLLRLFDIL